MSTRPRRELIINEDLPRFLRKTAAIIFVLSIAIGVITGLTIKFNSEFNTVLRKRPLIHVFATAFHFARLYSSQITVRAN